MSRVRGLVFVLAGLSCLAAAAAAQPSPASPPGDAGIDASARLGPPDPTLAADCALAEDSAAGHGAAQAPPGGRQGPTGWEPAAPESLSQGSMRIQADNLVALGAIAGLAFGGAAGFIAARAPAARPPAPKPATRAASAAHAPDPAPAGPPQTRPDGRTHLERLLARVREAPSDGKARFDLGLELLRRNEPELGVRHLSTSFHLWPQGVLRLLEDPTLVRIRHHPDVVAALRNLHRDQLRVFAGYA